MNMLKKLPWVTIIVAIFAALKWGPEIMGFLDEKAPSVAKLVTPKDQTTV